jgi:hypothetical protein
MLFENNTEIKSIGSPPRTAALPSFRSRTGKLPPGRRRATGSSAAAHGVCVVDAYLSARPGGTRRGGPCWMSKRLFWRLWPLRRGMWVADPPSASRIGPTGQPSVGLFFLGLPPGNVRRDRQLVLSGWSHEEGGRWRGRIGSGISTLRAVRSNRRLTPLCATFYAPPSRSSYGAAGYGPSSTRKAKWTGAM